MSRFSALRADRIPLYAQVLRVNIIDGPLVMLVGAIAGFRLLSPTPRTLIAAGLCILTGTLLFYLVHVLDDMTGLRTGVDQLTAPRKAAMGEPKLLAGGVVSLDEARALATLLCCVTGVLTLVLLVLAPPFVSALALGLAFITGQYSYGARWSYHGLGELAVLLNFAGCLLVPFALVTGRVTVGALCLAALCGMLLATVTFCSNALDYEEDRRAGRRSLAVLLGPARARTLLAAMHIALWTTYAIGLANGLLPRALAPALLLVVLHGLMHWQLHTGRIASARRSAFLASRLHAVFLGGALLVAGWPGGGARTSAGDRIEHIGGSGR